MYRIMMQKLWHKKWMNLCLLLGSILLIATVVSFPLYQTAAYDRMLQDEFRNYITTEGKWPTMNTMTVVSKKDKQGTTIVRMEEMMSSISDTLGVTNRESLCFYIMSKLNIHSTMNRQDAGGTGVRLAAMEHMEDHVEILSGEGFSETGLTENGEIEVLLTQSAMVNLNLLVGETIVFDDMKDVNGKEIKLYIKGIFNNSDNSDFYWQVSNDKLEIACLMKMDLFREMFTGANAAKYTITCYYYPMFEYEDIKASQVPALIAATDYLTEESAYRSTMGDPAYKEILVEYNKKLDRIRATLLILQIPVLIMLGAFLFMISGQMYDMERNEISVIKSRGSSGGQIFRLYLYQSTFISLVGGALGIPLGSVFSRILGSARTFLEFDSNRNLQLTFTTEVWIYAGCAMLATLLIMTLPAIKHSKVTIVKLKQQKALKKKNWWEIIFLDVILLGLSLYGYYSFHKNSDSLAESVLKGESLDPLLYISSSLFIVGLGLLFLRLQPYIIQLIYTLGKKFWKPASYASFMENVKNGRKQQFIMLFLIMTISLGMYHATVARTIMQNAYDNTNYLDGADIILKENWTAVVDQNGAKTGEYVEPDYSKYASMSFAEGYTRVLVDSDAYIKTGDNSRTDVTVMGVHTKEFGSITWVDYDLNGLHYYDLLNALAQNAKGILVSDNFANKMGYKLGDSVNYRNNVGKSVTGTIVGFFSYFPGYAPVSTGANPDGTVYRNENYLIIANYEQLRTDWGVMPYEIWIGLKADASSKDVYNWIEDNNVHIQKYVDKAADLQSTVEDPLLQGTNGVLTMGFIVTILLCAVGYLIYWIMSIKSREMIFGVLRACGMHKGELFHMLMNEQLFSGVFSIVAGIGIGKLASTMFVPILQQAYASTNQVLPMDLVVNSTDMFRLYGVILLVVLVCLITLILLLFKMNVAKALKLGEE